MIFERSLLIQPKELLLMVVDKWVDMYLLPLLQLVDDERKRGRDCRIGKKVSERASVVLSAFLA